MPLRSRPGTGKSRGNSAPPDNTTASKSASKIDAGVSTPMCWFTRNCTPSASICAMRRSMCDFSILKSGIPWRSNPPMRSDFSNTIASCPARANCCAAAKPAGPEPTTATRLPVLCFGGCGITQPISQPLSMIACSIDLIPTASLLMLSVHAASQGAGQTRPVNSGKLFVECSVSSASCQFCVNTRSLKSGMMLLTGQPV